ncbi:choice-of-anchor J domain-containing protein [Pseudoduganella sp. LjRoot289]|uniref:choice-of-anchor J domain-containing protein n=1 Tax=Pseudoduganella sp. LjRoot289 TaxID=3342314 RepID=UPI003ECD1B19
MIKKPLCALLLSGAAMSAHAGVLLQQSFDNVASLSGSGWVSTNASTPGGITGWYQGDQGIFSAQNGAPDSYAAANYNNAAAGGTLDNWLISPEFALNIGMGATVSFWLRGDAAQGYSDQVAVGISNGGSAIADFVQQATFTAQTDGWAQYTFSFLNTAGNARFAINYTGPADNANYIGIDSFEVAAIPEPATALLFGAGALGLLAARRRRAI